jgi:hypothetical protein
VDETNEQRGHVHNMKQNVLVVVGRPISTSFLEIKFLK